MKFAWALALLAMSAARGSDPAAVPAPDPYAWLENIDGPRALAWVKAQDDATAKRLRALPSYAGLYHDALTVLDNASRIPLVEPHGGYLYNLWQDARHPRGLYRRATLAEFRRPEPRWETVIDFDALAKAEGKPWSMESIVWRRPDQRRALVELAYGGGDTHETREFDVEALRFVPGGFFLPLAKSRAEWAGPDALLVATDFGPGTLSSSGYPLVAKLWRRGEPLSEAPTLFRAGDSSVGVGIERWDSDHGDIEVLSDEVSFFRRNFVQYDNGRLQPLTLPQKTVIAGNFQGRLVVIAKNPWTLRGKPVPLGSVLLADPAALRGGPGSIDVVLASSPSTVVKEVSVLKSAILVSELRNVSGRLERLVPAAAGWRREQVSLPANGTVTLQSVDDDSDDAWIAFESFTTPPSLYRLPDGRSEPELIKSQDAAFDGSRFRVTQQWAVSADGTRIPYFVVGAKDFAHDGRNPVWMFAYGGFEDSVTPSYSGSYEDLHGAYGKLWLERGGVFVLANLRGGGEFGPAWHEAALQANHVKAFEDFEAVARDIERRGITSPAHLGIEGRSNGGLLVASTMLRHPELYGAVVCGNPLLDMRRYSHLLAGASWIAEYGDPDIPAQWDYLRKYSPYQNVRPGMRLPPILFYTTTRDDRVHPGHARKMAAKMEAMGYTVDYAENTEGGHHGSVTHAQLAQRLASTYAFLWHYLGR